MGQCGADMSGGIIPLCPNRASDESVRRMNRCNRTARDVVYAKFNSSGWLFGIRQLGQIQRPEMARKALCIS